VSHDHAIGTGQNGHMRLPFQRSSDPDAPPKSDAGSGKLSDYDYNLIPRNPRVTIRLAKSDGAQDVLARAASGSEPEAFIARRTAEDERVDAPMPVRLFADGRPTSVVGEVPRGLESVVEAALVRWQERENKTRLPVAIVKTKAGLRVDLLIGETR
jgi:hypothetical protein